MKRSKKKIEKVAEGHTRGGLKTYRRACYDEIGGIREVDGWDGVDNLVAQMNGWETENFTEIKLPSENQGSYFGQRAVLRRENLLTLCDINHCS